MNRPSAHPARQLARFALLAIVLALLVLFARKVQWRETWAAVTGANPWIYAAALVINLGSAWTKAVRWWAFLRPVGVRSLWTVTQATFAGLALNNILVANGGEAARVIFVARHAHVPGASVLATVALERLFEFLGYVVMLSLAALLLPLPAALGAAKPVGLVGLVAIGALLVYLVRTPSAAERAAPTPTSLLHRARAYGSRFLGALREVSSPGRFAIGLAMAVLGWVLQIATYHLTAVAAGLPISIVGTISAILAVNLGFAIRATPGNVGVFQLIYAGVAAGYGLDADAAVAVALMIQAQQIIPVTLLGVLAAPQFLFDRAHARRATDPEDGAPIESR